MKTALNTSIEPELMCALEEYAKGINSTKSAVVSASLLKAIPLEFLQSNKVKEI